MRRFPRFIQPPKLEIPSRGLHQETWFGRPWYIRKLKLPKRLSVALPVELDPPEIVMGKRILGGEFDGTYECLTRWFEVVVGPFKEPEISVGILHPRVQTNGFPVLGTTLRPLAEAGQHDPTKIVDSRIIRLPAFRRD